MNILEFNNRSLAKFNYILAIASWKVNTVFFRLYAFLIGVKLGSGCEFRRWSSIYKTRESKLSFGTNCVVSSSKYNNPLIIKKCSFSTMENGAEISFGDNCAMSGVSVFSAKKVTVGNNVRIGANCIIMDNDFHLDDHRVGGPKEIIIEDGVWLGEGVKVLKGVTIGKGSMIGAGSIVTADVPENVIAAGVPCKVIRKIG